ncbi:MAG: DUF21 domain-containing protein [Planctomycetes bacterium]|nr:DUF21 domain-containing protein [Planctomycetota bacterium]
MTGLLVLLGACAVLSFVTSLWEGAFQGIPAGRAEALRKQGGRSALALASLRERLDETVAALLALDFANNAGVVVAVVNLAPTLAIRVGLTTAESSSPWAGIGLGAGMLTVFFLVADLFPRALGLAYAQPIALRSALLVQALVGALWPVALLGSRWVRWAKKGQPTVEAPAAEDVMALAASSARAGLLETREARWVSNALRLSEATVRQIMTPRSVVYALPAELPLSAVKAHSEHWQHSRLPIFRDRNPDEIVGMVLRRTVFDRLMANDTAGTLENLARPVLSVPDSMTLDHLLEWFVSRRQHLAVVRDEFQAWIGIVTLEDALESFLGAEIVDEKDKVVDMRELARKRAEEKGVKAT